MTSDFMQPQIQLDTWLEVEDEYEGTYFIPRDLAETIQGTLRINKWGARLSAPGYLDCTEWNIFDTWEEARDYLVETYYDDPESEIPEELR